MAGEINYFKVFDVAEGETAGLAAESADSAAEPAGSASGNAPEHGGQGLSREDSTGSVTRAKKTGGAQTEEIRPGAGQRQKRLQTDEENARFAARRREREAAARRQGQVKAAGPAGGPDAGGTDGNAVVPGEFANSAADPAGSAAETGPVDGQADARESASETLGGSVQQPAEMPEPNATVPANEPPGDNETPYGEQLKQLRLAEAAARAERDFAVDRSVRQRIENEVSEIGRLDPSVRSFEDLRNSPDYARLGELVRSGISLVDAYKLTHFDRLRESAAMGARQAALNAREGKAHLQQLGGTGGDTPPAVPGEVLRAYRAIMPDLGVREIEQHYNQYLKG